MNAIQILELMQQVSKKELSPEQALQTLQFLPTQLALGFEFDTYRELRCGMPEVIYAKGKTYEQVIQAVTHLFDSLGYVLATGVDSALASRIEGIYPEACYVEQAKLLKIRQMSEVHHSHPVRVVCAGTSDLPVALEALHTLQFAGLSAELIADVGVAGLHRLLRRIPDIQGSSAVIAVAGMEGTLPGVLTGLISKPVIAVPTSVGYGSHGGGLAPLLAMLNSCASGMSVVNIDNGFGAAMMAIRIVKSQISDA